MNPVPKYGACCDLLAYALYYRQVAECEKNTGVRSMKTLKIVVLVVLATGLVACQSGQRHAAGQHSESKAIVIALPNGQGGELKLKMSSNSSASLLVNELESVPSMIGFARAQRVSLNEYGPDIYKAAYSGDPSGVPTVAKLGALQAAAADSGTAACKNWRVGREPQIQTTASIYCTTWKDTLDANITLEHNVFLATAGGAQYMRAKAEFLAAASKSDE